MRSETGLMGHSPGIAGITGDMKGFSLDRRALRPAATFREDDMNLTTRRAFGVAGFALLLVTSASFAQQPPPVRVRGTVEAVDGAVLTVKSRDGQTVYKVKMADNVAVGPMCSILICGGSDSADFSTRPACSSPPMKVVKLDGATPWSSFRMPRIQTLAVS